MLIVDRHVRQAPLCRNQSSAVPGYWYEISRLPFASFVPHVPSMAPQLQVLVSGSSAYPPNKPLSVNAVQPTPIKTPDFEGEINVWVKDFDGKGKGGEGEEYFGKRETMTYAIVVRGGLSIPFISQMTS